MRKIWILFLILIFGLVFPVSIFSNTSYSPSQEDTQEEAQEIQYDESTDLNPVSFDKQSIEKFQSKKDFDYTEPEAVDTWWTQFKRWVAKIWYGFWDWLLGDYSGNAFLNFLIKVLPYLIVVCIVGFIIWLFYKLNPGASFFKRNEMPSVFFSEEEEIIKNSNIEELIEQALLNKDFRLAVRYYYLRILKYLSEAEIINYEADKTNSDYNREIDSEEIKTGFRKATLLYDYIWYGSFDVTDTDFTKAQRTFSSLESLIPRTDE